MTRNRHVAVALIFGVLATLQTFAATVPPPLPPTLANQLEALRAKYDCPAVAGAIVTTDGIKEQAEVGGRKRGSPVAVTKADLWHLGSDSKVMTALLVGTYVVERKLDWSTAIVSFFPEIAAQVPAANRGITIGDVLSHSAGLRGDLDWYALGRHGTVVEQRQIAAKQSLTAPQFPPGTYHYANSDYVLIAALLERMTGRSWEDLISERVFKPLHMDSAGFYRAAKMDAIDQPWPHDAQGHPILPTNFANATITQLGTVELPPILAPAGLIHCSMDDWAKFLADQLRGAAGMPALLPAPLYHAMQTARPGSPYAYGWGITERSWAGGKTLMHAGSDLLNYCVCFLAPSKKFGVLACTNQGGDRAFHLCDEVANTLVLRQLESEQASRAASVVPQKPR